MFLKDTVPLFGLRVEGLGSTGTYRLQCCYVSFGLTFNIFKIL